VVQVFFTLASLFQNQLERDVHKRKVRKEEI